MKKRVIRTIILLLAAALAISIVQTVFTRQERIGELAAIAAADSGKTWAAVYEPDKIVFHLVNRIGVTEHSFTVPRKSGDEIAQIADMAADEQGRLYFIRHYSGASTGKFTQKQELTVYTPKLLPFGRMNTVRLDSTGEYEGIRYMDVHVSTSLVITGVSDDGASITRKAYDLSSLSTIKAVREYPSNPAEGVYKLAASGTDTAFISMTGKLFVSAEGAESPVRLYPDAAAEMSTYASFITESTPGQVIVGEQTSGNVLRVFTSDGRIEYILEGGRAFGALTYTSKDIYEMSLSPGSTDSWSATVTNPGTDAPELIVCVNGEYSLIAALSDSFLTAALKILGNTLLYALIFAAAAGAAFGIYYMILRSRTILLKLVLVSIPLLVVALALFGAYSYTTYASSLRGTYETKVSDQGNLLRALFSSASFDKIAAPGMYNSVEYSYLRTQMGTRDVYTSSAYFVDGKLYTGVDWELPCLYRFDIRSSPGAKELYRAAALNGTQQAGTITDRWGTRIVCVTPVGSSSGNTVFLLETGIFQAEIDSQTSGFLRNYLIISLLCLVCACALLLGAFLRILKPLGGIIDGLVQFSKGNRLVRLESRTNDELADISRVFNKMAKDIDVQIYNLRSMGETYYRFVPQQVFQILGKENLADIQLGSAVEGKYCVLVVNLYPRPDQIDFNGIREHTNRFFAIVHKVAGENGATLLSDSAGLRDLRLICPSGDSAVLAAMDAIARIDEHNAKSPISQRLDVSFFLHYTQMGFGICGDYERYVPAMISSELDEALVLCEDFRRLSSRLIVTEAAYRILDSSKYFHRYIGQTEDEGASGLYDFYDSSLPSVIRLLNDTLGAFNKAMELYEQKRYYDAKNMFAAVLRENQYDNVARHYIFRCEKQL